MQRFATFNAPKITLACHDSPPFITNIHKDVITTYNMSVVSLYHIARSLSRDKVHFTSLDSWYLRFFQRFTPTERERLGLRTIEGAER